MNSHVHTTSLALGRSGVGERVALLAVDDGVDTGDLVLARDAEADRLLDREADDEGDDEGVDQHATCGDGLDGQQAPVTTGEHALSGGEEAEVEGTDEATDEVDADDVERVVEAETELQLDGQGADDTGDEAEDQ